jgi:UDP-4-amino-4-deoxy-L-arabinose formyltransferase/UDP-glucuronic acid dehydrogenase (UDP-4-keto-hexauronic acid decarboxylating)
MKVFALATAQAGVDLLRLIAPQVPLGGIIGLSDLRRDDSISGYVYMAPIADELGVGFIKVEDYSLQAVEDRERLLRLDIDFLLVCGWQRLVPAWLIEHCKIGVIGSHGSPAGISGGRGRSPQNWALICGAGEFDISIFFITPGVDDGPVISTRSYPLTADDDIASSYLKCGILTAEMIVEAFQKGLIDSRSAREQGQAGYYLPQRLPDDGQIDWGRSTKEIIRFIRALTRPYPGAFTFVDRARMKVWNARPFEMRKGSKQPKAGEIILHAWSNKLVVATGDGMLLIDEYELATYDHKNIGYLKGKVFEPCDFAAQMQTIVARHLKRYPHYRLSPMVLRGFSLNAPG